jgi:hypothetical protein
MLSLLQKFNFQFSIFNFQSSIFNFFKFSPEKFGGCGKSCIFAAPNFRVGDGIYEALPLA